VVTQLQGRLSNKSYVQNAPKQIVEQTKTQLADANDTLDRLRTEQARFTNA
jgi:valyl-tRNA synthetase